MPRLMVCRCCRAVTALGKCPFCGWRNLEPLDAQEEAAYILTGRVGFGVLDDGYQT